ncbi:hypothetical protein ACFQT0_08675 [Hymenobacter humi]|uniref:Uncharacterized protein n=1 Tax=Hymenobacter humi TaxID=1411620 RepID=A0ABW2U292_9BACT
MLALAGLLPPQGALAGPRQWTPVPSYVAVRVMEINTITAEEFLLGAPKTRSPTPSPTPPTTRTTPTCRWSSTAA